MIGIFGDSFADPIPGESTRPSETWMNALGYIANVVQTSHGICGCSVWKSYEEFLNNYKKYSHIVFCYTFPHRIPHLNDQFQGFNYIRPDSLPNLEFLSDKDKKKMKNVIDTYWRYLQNDLLDVFLYQQIFNSVNEICKRENINLVNVFPFEHQNYVDKQIIDLAMAAGDCYLGLQYISNCEVDVASDPLSIYAFDPRDCHLTKENNFRFAELINNSFNNNQCTIYHLDVDDYGFIFDQKISDRYFSKEKK